MTVEEQEPSRARGFIGTAIRSRYTLWSAFILAHLLLGAQALYGPGGSLGDVTIMYKFWTDQALVAHYWVGIDQVWVYPIVAIVPMLLAFTFGPALYASTWLSIVMILNAAAFACLTGWGPRGRNVAAGWWWVAFLVALGPIVLGRIDAISVPLALMGVLFLATRPRVAALVLTIATWIKVWPAALLAAIVIASRARRPVIATAVLVSLGIIAIALTFGSGLNVLSFITQQTGRGLQVEAPITTAWMWRAFAGVPATFVYYDTDILTYQVAGSGTELASSLATPIMAVAAVVTLVIGVLAVRRGTDAARVLPVLALALVTVLIAFNKVGSPQFISWLAVPVVLGLVTRLAGRGVSFRVPAVVVLVIAALTQVIYPALYSYLLWLEPGMLVVLTVRNLLLFVVLGWALRALWRMSRAVPERDRLDVSLTPKDFPA